jgi:hypothetical protein
MTPAERLHRQYHSAGGSISSGGGQLVVVPPHAKIDPLEAVVDRRTARLVEADPERAAAILKQQSASKSPRRGRGQMGTEWYHCLFYPIRAWPVVGGLPLALTALSIAVVLLLPELLDLETSLALLVLAWTGFVIPLLLVAGYALAFFDCVLTSSVAGEVRHIHWPGRDIGIIADGILIYLTCFLAGPIIPSIAGLWFWLQATDPIAVDKLILAELAIVAAVYWVLALVSVARSGRLLDALPARVADAAYELGRLTLLAAVVTGALAAAHGYWLFTAITQLHVAPGSTILSLAACWLSGMYCGTCAMRYLGLSCHRNQQVKSAAATAGVES